MIEMDLQKSRHEHVSEQINASVMTREPGSKLPTIRSLMKQYNVSQATIDRSLSVLVEKGVIERKPGLGYFVVDHKKKRQEFLKIDFCCFFKKNVMENPLYSEMISDMLTEAYNVGCFINVFAYEEMGNVQAFRKRFEQSKPHACIMLGCNKMSFEYVLRDLNIPSVHLYPNIQEPSLNSYLIDNYGGMKVALERLYEQGHKRIALVHGQGFDNFHMIDQEERMEAFYEIMSEHELGVGGKNVIYGGFNPDDGYSAACELLKQMEFRRPTAIICNDYNAPGVYRAIAENNLSIPGDVSIVGFDNISQIKFLAPALATVDIKWKKAIKGVVKKACQLAMGENISPETVRIPVEFVDGQSIGQVKN